MKRLRPGNLATSLIQNFRPENSQISLFPCLVDVSVIFYFSSFSEVGGRGEKSDVRRSLE